MHWAVTPPPLGVAGYSEEPIGGSYETQTVCVRVDVARHFDFWLGREQRSAEHRFSVGVGLGSGRSRYR
jgi:hypothetical protein